MLLRLLLLCAGWGVDPRAWLLERWPGSCRGAPPDDHGTGQDGKELRAPAHHPPPCALCVPPHTHTLSPMSVSSSGGGGSRSRRHTQTGSINSRSRHGQSTLSCCPLSPQPPPQPLALLAHWPSLGLRSRHVGRPRRRAGYSPSLGLHVSP